MNSLKGGFASVASRHPLTVWNIRVYLSYWDLLHQKMFFYSSLHPMDDWNWKQGWVRKFQLCGRIIQMDHILSEGPERLAEALSGWHHSLIPPFVHSFFLPSLPQVFILNKYPVHQNLSDLDNCHLALIISDENTHISIIYNAYQYQSNI